MQCLHDFDVHEDEPSTSYAQSPIKLPLPAPKHMVARQVCA